MSSSLKKWLKKEDVYDADIEQILADQGINDPETDFKGYSQAQWDELYRKSVVERAKDLKDQKAKVRLEKKLTKIEKFWRKASGIKKTSVTKSQKKSGKKGKKGQSTTNASKSANTNALKEAAALKKYMQKNGCFDKDLLIILSQQGIQTEDDLSKIDSNSKFDDIYRQVRVLRAKELKDNAAKLRLEKLMTKFEKLWRSKTGIKKKSSQTKGGKKTKKKDPKSSKNEELDTKGKELKNWMKKNKVWEKALYDELMNNNICTADELQNISQSKFDEIVRKVRVDRFSQLKDQKARNRADKLLVTFEKAWRKASGIKKTSIQDKNGKKKKGKKEKKPAKKKKKEAPKEEEKKDIEYAVGDKVVVQPSKKGQIKWIGEAKEFGPGTFYGVRLTENRGTCDGEWKEKRFFQCPEGFGVYVPLRQIKEKIEADFDFMNEEEKYEEEARAKAEIYKKEAEKLKMLREKFNEVDTDGNQTIDRDEFNKLATEIFGCKTAEANELFKEIDVNGSGNISFAEFDNWVDKIGGVEELNKIAGDDEDEKEDENANEDANEDGNGNENEDDGDKQEEVAADKADEDDGDKQENENEEDADKADEVEKTDDAEKADENEEEENKEDEEVNEEATAEADKENDDAEKAEENAADEEQNEDKEKAEEAPAADEEQNDDDADKGDDADKVEEPEEAGGDAEADEDAGGDEEAAGGDEDDADKGDAE